MVGYMLGCGWISVTVNAGLAARGSEIENIYKNELLNPIYT